MNKNTKNTKSKKHAGRPAYQPIFPKTDKWTFEDFQAANDGKCTKLTLRNFLKGDMKTEDGKFRGNSIVKLIKNEFGEKHSSGMGRRPLLYHLRSVAVVSTPSVETPKASKPAKVKKVKTPKAPKTSKPRKSKGSNVSVNVGTSTADYEAKKAALLAPETAPAVVETPAQVSIEIAETPAGTPETAPAVAETPAATPETVPAETLAV